MTFYHILKELPGRHTFHSAILTTYSIDFYFLEQRVVSSLRKRGIRNISVIADARMMEDCITSMGQNIKNASSLYTLNTILCNGAFHPKIHFMVGDNAMMCVIGSGNLSSGGGGKNHEIFTTLYADKDEKGQLGLLLSVWQYLKSISKSFKGVSAEQIKWMEDHCNLFQDQHLITEPNSFVSFGDVGIAFLTNEKAPLFTGLQKVIPNPDSVSKITIVSPYFDEHGKLLSELLASFPKAKIDVLVQPSHALLPLKFSQSPKVTFYDFKDVKLESDNSKFLHGKILHFQIKDEELMVLGSANATNRAFLRSSKGNMEAVVVMMGKQQQWLDQLGISGAKTKVDLANLIAPLKHTDPDEFRSTMLYKIIAVDLRSICCKLYLSTPVVKGTTLTLYNGEGEILFVSPKLPIEIDTIEVTLSASTRLNEVLYGACVDSQNSVVSNRQVVNNEQSIWSNNPSPENRKIALLLDKIASGEYSELDLFEYYDVILGESVHKAPQGSKSNGVPDEKPEDKQLSYAEAKELVNETKPGDFLSEEFTIRVLNSYIDSIRLLAQKREEDNIDDEEDGNIATGVQREQTEKKNKSFTSKSVAERTKKKIVTYFEKYADKLTSIDTQDYKVTQSDYAFFILSISHLVAITDEEYTYKNKDVEIAERVIMIPTDGAAHEYTSFHSIAINIIGKFLSYIQYSAGEKEYQNDFDQVRLQNFKVLSVGVIAFSLSLISHKCKFNKSKFDKWHMLIMLNLIDVFGQQHFDFKQLIASQMGLFDIDGVSLIENVAYLQDLHTRSLELFEDIKSNEIRDCVKKYRIVYIVAFGFCYVEKAIPNLATPICIKISNLGFDYNIEEYVAEEFYHIERDEFLPGKHSLEN